ncbi:hypothetical protein [Lewinella cohaerens]|uniref:hypothetical protein n=1 Tax=Lewinella cohaerens TaxID=70995 RepID=UPI00036CDFF9|nr:hypothetical protein [Lewinella cohaerens]
MKNITLLLLLAICCWSCGPEAPPANAEAEATETTEEEAPTQQNTFLIRPGEGFGDFNDELAKADLMRLLGKNRIAPRAFYLGEGETAPGLVLYPDSPEEVEVLLDEDGYPIMYRIQEEGSEWATKGGLKIGSSLADLEKINGQPFKLTGFDWDYGGTVTNWNGGTFADKDFMVVLGYDVDAAQFTEEDMEQLLGDQEIISTLPALRRYPFKVVTITQRY